MMREEFEKLTGTQVTGDEYREIEKEYMANTLTKQEFCKRFKKKSLLKSRLSRIEELESKLKEIKEYAIYQKLTANESINNEHNHAGNKKSFEIDEEMTYANNRYVMGLEKFSTMCYLIEMVEK